MPSTFPLVSALMLTRNRRALIQNSILDFLAQVKCPQLELVILNDSDAEHLDDLVVQGAVGDGKFIALHSAPKMSIGPKRNHGVNLCHGSIIANWDDDDRYAPMRIYDQVSRLIESGKQVTGYHTAPGEGILGRNGRWIYETKQPVQKIIPTPPPYAIGSSLVFWKSWALSHPFPNCDIGEDNMFVSEANRHKALISSDGREMMTIGIHPGNTSVKRVENAPWRKL